MKRPRIKRIFSEVSIIKKTTIQNKKSLEKSKNKLNKKILDLKKRLEKEEKYIFEIEFNKKRILIIEKDFKRAGNIGTLKFNSEYNALRDFIKNNNGNLELNKQRIKKVENELEKVENELEKVKNELEIKKKLQVVIPINKSKDIDKIKENSRNLNTRPSTKKLELFRPQYTDKKIFEVDWVNVFFDRKKIVIKHKDKWYEKFVPQSKKFLNEIKAFYTFHNIPKLIIKIENGRVIIKNEEVLLYHLDFLTVTASNFGYLKLSLFNISHWKKYNKKYYEKKLPFLFHTQTLKKLCEYCDLNLPIIPLGEVVKSQTGNIVIHNSFLFPIKTKKGYFLIWESIEDGKASYVFSIKAYSEDNIQNIFNFIAGETPNKRSTLINSKELQNKLGMKKRIFHTDMNKWELSIRQLN